MSLIHSSAKLTVEQVQEIWKLLQEGNLTQDAIASMFGVTQETVNHINTGTRWNSVTGLPRRSKKTLVLAPSKSFRGRPRAAKIRSSTGVMARAGKRHYKILAKAAVQAILYEKSFVRVRFPSLVNFPKDFPTRKFESIDETGVVEIIRADLLLDWLHANTYCVWSVKDINRQREIVSAQLRWVERAIGLDKFD